jgi:mono/diheme cytochrome c family protein
MRSRNAYAVFVLGVSCVAFTLAPIGDTSAADNAKTVWEGAYTKAQAERGKARYFSACASCHGVALQGDGDIPELVGKSFLKRWSDQPISALFAFSVSQMPIGRPGSLGTQGYADVIAHILATNGFPDGSQELPADAAALDGIILEGKK